MKLTLILVLVVLSQLAVALAISVNIPWSKPRLSDELAALAQAAGGHQPVEFHTADGVLLRGEILGNVEDRPVVVYGHGYRNNRNTGDPLAVELLQSGYAMMRFDFRACGWSGGWLTGAGAIESPDVQAALDAITVTHKVPANRVAYVGVSMGAAAAMLTASSLTRLGAVVLVAPYAHLEDTMDARTRTWAGVPLRPWFTPATLLLESILGATVKDTKPAEHMSRISPAPVLILAAQDDWRAPPSAATECFNRAQAPRRLTVLDHGDHNFMCALGPEVCAPIFCIPQTTRSARRSTTGSVNNPASLPVFRAGRGSPPRGGTPRQWDFPPVAHRSGH